MAAGAVPSRSSRAENDGDLAWRIAAPLVLNGTVWFGLLVSLGGGTASVVFLLVGLALFRGDWEFIPTLVLVCMGILAGLLALCALIMVGVFGWRVPTEYRITDRHVAQAHLSRRARGAVRLALLAAPLAGARGAGLAGSAALAEARQAVAVPWGDIRAARFFPQRGEIQLRNEWRTLLQVFCPPELYDDVAARVRDKLERRKPATAGDSSRLPTPLRVVLTLLTVPPIVLLFAPLPIEIHPALTASMGFLALVTIWTTGAAQRSAGLGLVLVILLALGLAVSRGAVDRTTPGAGASLVVQGVLLSALLSLGIVGLANCLRRAPRGMR